MEPAKYAYDAYTSWTNSLFLDFSDSALTSFMTEWREEHGLTHFPPHATLITVDESRFPPDEADTPSRVASAIKEVLEELKLGGKSAIQSLF